MHGYWDGGGCPLQTCSLVCTNPNCTLGENGAKYKAPEFPLEFAMQMLVMHDTNNHHQPRPAQVVERSLTVRTARQKKLAARP